MRYFITSLLLLLSFHSLPCTTFLLNDNGKFLFGRNYDWITDAGLVCTNLRGLSKTSLKTSDGATISWTSQYGSITFNQYGKEFPTGGMNEQGLVVELMWLDGSQYPKPDNRPAIGVLQWIQYQLDNCATIDDVIATDKKLRISSKGNAPLHYLVADASGKAATIEFLDGVMVVHKGTDLSMPVLTNSTYAESIRSYNNSKDPNSKDNKGAGFEYGNNSLQRFGQACNMINQFTKRKSDYPSINYAFDILSEVAQGTSTKWGIVYDITNKSIHFRTNSFKEIKQVHFSSFDFSCKGGAKMWDMNQEGIGNVSSQFVDYSIELNKKIVDQSFRESKPAIDIPDALKQENLEYSKKISCQ